MVVIHPRAEVDAAILTGGMGIITAMP